MQSFDRAENGAQANNQWNIGADLGNDPMESAFARTLTAGIKGVAMVLDQEVQPLTSDSTNMSRRDSAAMYLSFSRSFVILRTFPSKKKRLPC